MTVNDAGIAWAESVWGRRISGVRSLAGGWTSTTLRLDAVSGERAVLRLMTKEPWRRHAAELLAREAEIQRRLIRAPIPAPRSIAVDPSGADAGVPAHLMSWIPGRLELAAADEQVLGKLAELLATIHRFDPGPVRPRTFQSWAGPSKRVVPDWSPQPWLWEQAFEELAQPQPSYTGTFLHRDFHLGNVLWAAGEVSGVVDWVETSWGPAGLDVAHASTYLAMLHGGETADRFTEAYRKRAGGRFDDDEHRYWSLMDIVGYLPDPCKVTRPWRDVGYAISDDLARARLEQRLLWVLAPHAG